MKPPAPVTQTTLPDSDGMLTFVAGGINCEEKIIGKRNSE